MFWITIGILFVVLLIGITNNKFWNNFILNVCWKVIVLFSAVIITCTLTAKISSISSYENLIEMRREIISVVPEIDCTKDKEKKNELINFLTDKIYQYNTEVKRQKRLYKMENFWGTKLSDHKILGLQELSMLDFFNLEFKDIETLKYIKNQH